jgi:hypothetical protein
MTRVQELEVRRFTQNIWTLLYCVDGKPTQEAEVCGPFLRTARILKRRGFVSLVPGSDRGFYGVRLTDAGREALISPRQTRPRTAHFP